MKTLQSAWEAYFTNFPLEMMAFVLLLTGIVYEKHFVVSL